MLDHRQLRELIVDVLKDMEPEVPYSDAAVELLMLTAAVESNLGTYLEQVRGPALGIFQMEPATVKDIWDTDMSKSNDNFLSYRPKLEKLANQYYNHNWTLDLNMRGNLPYQILMARMKYLRSPKPLPSATNKRALAAMWKEVYNTYLGKGTIEKAIQKYDEFVGV